MVDSRLAQHPQRAVDCDDGAERLRDPDHIHIECEAPAGISHSAVAPASRMAIPIRVALEGHEVRRDRIVRVRSRPMHHVPDVLAQRRPPPPREGALACVGHAGVGEVVAGDHRQLEVVVHHPVVLARRLEIAEQRAVARLEELGAVLPNRLASERFFVAHFAVGRELEQRRAHHELRHRVGPHRLHQQRRHQHVAAEVRRVGRQPRHQLLARAEQLEAAYLALQAWRLGGVGELAERGVEDLIAIQGIERRTVGRDFDQQLHRLGTAGTDRQHTTGELRAGLFAVAADRQPHVVFGIKARLIGLRPPARSGVRQREQRDQAAGIRAAESFRERGELLRHEGWGVDRIVHAPRVSEVALDAHRAEEELANFDRL